MSRGGETPLRAARAGVVAEHFELNEQTLARVARAAADGVELQDELSRLLDALGGCSPRGAPPPRWSR